jgi:Protein ENHANCED DISEASE RESISTANCE 2, C-terminal
MISSTESGRSTPISLSISPSVPSTVQSSCSDGDSDDGRTSPIYDMLLQSGKAGSIAPNATCMQRCLSAGVVTDPERKHELLEGRPTIVYSSGSSSIQKSTLQRCLTVPCNTHLYAEATSHPAPLRLDAWSEAVAGSFSVRGAQYLRDAKKNPSLPSLFRLLTVDLVSADRPNFKGMCSHPSERIQTALRTEQETGEKLLPEFVFAVNLCVPSAGSGRNAPAAAAAACYHWVAYFGIEDKNLITTDQTAIGRLCNKFFFGDSDTFRDNTFKLIPRIADGNFVVRKAVGSKPSILGKKLKQHYIRTDRFLELIVDIGSDSVATRIVKLALGYAKSLTVDMMFVLEGVTDDTLPERILGGVRVKNVDFKNKDGQRVCSGV